MAEEVFLNNKRISYVAILSAIILMGFLVRVWLYQQPVNSDDVQYFVDAGKCLTSSFSEPLGDHISANALRVFFLASIGVYQYILGCSLSAYYAAIYGSAILSLLGVLSFSSAVSSRAVTALASLLWATSYVSILTDTRLLPDNFGTAMSLFALTALVRAGGFKDGRNSAAEESGHRALLSNSFAAFIGGLLLWSAWSARATFAVFGLPALVIILISDNRWRLLAAFMSGLALGSAFEMLIVTFDHGDPLFRLKLLLGYGADRSSSRLFQGYTFGGLFARYPRILAQTGSAEIAVFGFGLLGALVWAVRWRNGLNLVKFTALAASYALIACAITRFDPPVPLLREKLRYYATAAPLFYLATAELMVMAWNQLCPNPASREVEMGHSGWRRWGRSFVILLPSLAIASLGIFICCKNILVTSRCASLARNGNDNFFAAVEAIRSHAKDDDGPKRIYNDFRTTRVLSILLPLPENWQLSDYFLRSEGGGYLLVNWERLNRNVRRDYFDAAETYRFFGTIENMPLLLRHRHGNYLTDVFVVPKKSFHRDTIDITNRLPGRWTRWQSRETGARVLPNSDRFEVGQKGWVYSGTDAPWKPPSGSGTMPGDHFVEVIFDGRSPRVSGLAGYLYYWREGDKLPQKQYLGRVYIDEEVRSVALWTYLAQDAKVFRVLFRVVSGAPVDVHVKRLLMLERTDDDTVMQKGGAW